MAVLKSNEWLMDKRIINPVRETVRYGDEQQPIVLRSVVTEREISNGITDQVGAIYSSDGMRLLKGADVAHYTIRAGTRVVCDGAFLGCEHLESVGIPESMVIVGDGAFQCCQRLTAVRLPGSLEHIGDDAFSECSSLTSIIIPDMVTHIGEGAFSKCI